MAPDHSRARLNLGRLLRRQQRPQEASAAFQIALESDPRPPIQYEANYYLGHLSLDRQNYLEAYRSFRAALAAASGPTATTPCPTPVTTWGARMNSSSTCSVR